MGRAGTIKTQHGVIETPAFVTVGTQGTVKALTPEIVKDAGAQVVLANTYHLFLQPGDEIVKKAGGLGKFMNWSGPTMTDSGGFQVFSLGAAYGKGISKVVSKNKELLLPEAGYDTDEKEAKPRLVHIDHDGVMFRSHINGDAHYFTPEKSIEIQHNLGADIIFAFDECTSPTESIHYQREALDRTHRWAKKSLIHHKKLGGEQALFGIVQGGRHENLRKESAAVIGAMDFDGFGIGGSFAKEDMNTAVQWVNEVLPEEKPRHLLGIGEPLDLFNAVESGCDLFDCVIPTRLGRNGTIFTKRGKIHIGNAEYVTDFSPIDEGCECYTCKNYTKAYIAHLFRGKEMLAGTLASAHNLYFIIHMVKGMRQAILDGNFEEYKESFLKHYRI
ncbi:tRNA guanosine(34) transglycosylase Tgt [Candidatus Parcubacteria bacterium]|nr:tRNA guanosine(34) transglycosylase Tgt [Candidatus Parcubacteria bacterium]